MSANGDFVVRVMKNDVVSPALPVQEHRLPLSNLDLIFPPIEFCVFFCYDRNYFTGDVSFGSKVASLKKALAETLVPYYAMAGELTTNSLGEPELLCNNNGVHFSQAHADVRLRDLNLHILEESMYRLVPETKPGVLSVQATELSCGSVIVSCRVDHRVADAYSTNLFLVSWAESARSTPISVVPSFRRSLLRPRQPLKLDPTVEELYFPLSSLSPPKQNPKPEDDDDKIVSRVFYVKADKIDEIQRLASSENTGRVTKLEAMSAVIWKLTAKAEQTSGRVRKTTLGVAVDGRTRLPGVNGVNELYSYFGNVLAFPFRGGDAEDLAERPLGSVAREVHGVIESAAKEEHFMGLIDLVEAHRPKSITPGIYWAEDGPIVAVSSGRRFPVTEVDFGWGPPVFGSVYFREWVSSMEYVMPMPSPTVDGDWVIYTLLRRRVVDLILQVAGDVFHPMTNQYLTRGTTKSFSTA